MTTDIEKRAEEIKKFIPEISEERKTIR